MPPTGLAILLGAGPVLGSGIARVLASPTQGNLAVALLSRTASADLASSLSKSSNDGILVPFQTDTSASSLTACFEKIKSEEKFKGLKLKVCVWNVKHSYKTTVGKFVEEETPERFGDSLQTFVTGAMVFAQQSIKWMLEQDSSSSSTGDGGAADGKLEKKGTLIFTGTLGALRTNAGFAAYGAGRSGVRMLAQSLGKEYSGRGVHVAHVVINGAVADVDVDVDEVGVDEKRRKCDQGEMIRAESVGRNYLWLSEQEADCWVDELDLRPAMEKF
jgi:NAD(P)-dependent dehydrogenase (short-subunit alcohol dehydrogenase family)